MDQFCAFSKSAAKMQAIDQASMISAVAIAQGEPKKINEAIKEIVKNAGN